MLLDDDIVTDGEAKPCPLARRLCCEERIEHLVLHLGRNAGPIVANADLDAVPEIPGGRSEGWLIAIVARLILAFCCRIEAVRNQVQQDPRDFLWEKVNLAGGWIE